MFGIAWSNSQTLWLNLTNAALGAVTIICAGVIAKGIPMQFGLFSAREIVMAMISCWASRLGTMNSVTNSQAHFEPIATG